MQFPRLYVSGPMSNIPEYNFPAFQQAAEDLRAAGYEVVSPHEVNLPCGCRAGTFCGVDPEHAWPDYIRADLIAMLQGCDAIASLPGCEASRGAQLEFAVASGLGWRIQPVAHWVSEAASAFFTAEPARAWKYEA